MTTAFQLSRIGIDVNLPTSATYELLLVTTPEYPVGQVGFQFENTPRKITGIQKVAQLFLKVLFTQKGTDVLYPAYGTAMPSIIYGANLQLDDTDTYLALTDAVSDAEAQVKYITGYNSDPASTLTQAQPAGFNSTQELVSLYIWIQTAAGENASIAIPFPQLDLPILSS